MVPSKWGSPIYQHKCSKCVFLGTMEVPITTPFGGKATRDCDFYFCDSLVRSIVCRFGNQTGAVKRVLASESPEDPIWAEAIKRAKEMGFECVDGSAEAIKAMAALALQSKVESASAAYDGTLEIVLSAVTMLPEFMQIEYIGNCAQIDPDGIAELLKTTAQRMMVVHCLRLGAIHLMKILIDKEAAGEKYCISDEEVQEKMAEHNRKRREPGNN